MNTLTRGDAESSNHDHDDQGDHRTSNERDVWSPETRSRSALFERDSNPIYVNASNVAGSCLDGDLPNGST
jgi:hypothetical protein